MGPRLCAADLSPGAVGQWRLGLTSDRVGREGLVQKHRTPPPGFGLGLTLGPQLPTHALRGDNRSCRPETDRHANVSRCSVKRVVWYSRWRTMEGPWPTEPVNFQNIIRVHIGRRAGDPEADGKRVLRELSGHNPMPQGDQGTRRTKWL